MQSVILKAGEQVVIGPDVIVKVLEVAAGRVRLGIEAPSGSSVRRGEAAAQIPEAVAASPRRGPRPIP
jgi:carbon storage regulator CsrA